MSIEYKKLNEISFNDIVILDSQHELCSLAENALNRQTGGEITGTVSIVDGNYIQAKNTAAAHIYSGKTSFVQANSTSYGDPYVGSRGFCVIGVFPETNEIQISGEIPSWMRNVDSNRYGDDQTTIGGSLGNSGIEKQMLTPAGIEKYGTDKNLIQLSDMLWSVEISIQSVPCFSHIVGIDAENGRLRFDNLPKAIQNLSALTYREFIDMFENDDDNGLYVVKFPLFGNIQLDTFHTNHVEGASNAAIGKTAHAEGIGTVANARYSHAEGQCTFAAGASSHAEGLKSVAFGNHSHAEGNMTLAKKADSHAEGCQTSAIGQYSHAEGVGSVAEGTASHAEGGYTTTTVGGYAKGNGSHAEGSQTSAIGDYSHAEGKLTYTYGNCSHAEGSQTSAIGDYSHAAGNNAIASGFTSYIWNGSGTQKINDVDGSFAIWPKNGINGFYIDGESLGTTLDKITHPLTEPNTIITFENGEISSYDFSGTLDYGDLNAKGLRSGSAGEPEWLSSIVDVKIGYKVTKISSYVFYKCTALTSVTIPESVSRIQPYTFKDCPNLSSITIPNSVKSLEKGLFTNNRNLAEVFLSSNIELVAEAVFSNCNSLTGIYIENTKQEKATELSNTVFSGRLPSNKCKVIGYGRYDINREYIDSRDSALSADLVEKIRNSLSGISELTSSSQIEMHHITEALFNLAQIFKQ